MLHHNPTADIIDIPTQFNSNWSDFKTDDTHCSNDQFVQMFQAQTRLHRRIEYLQMRIAHLNLCLNHEPTIASL